MLKADYYTPPTEMDLLVFEKLLPQDHYLRRVKEAIDFEPMRQLVADCYSPDQGRGAAVSGASAQAPFSGISLRPVGSRRDPRGSGQYRLSVLS